MLHPRQLALMYTRGFHDKIPIYTHFHGKIELNLWNSPDCTGHQCLSPWTCAPLENSGNYVYHTIES